jgi:hypothetical protein
MVLSLSSSSPILILAHDGYLMSFGQPAGGIKRELAAAKKRVSL